MRWDANGLVRDLGPYGSAPRCSTTRVSRFSCVPQIAMKHGPIREGRKEWGDEEEHECRLIPVDFDPHLLHPFFFFRASNW